MTGAATHRTRFLASVRSAAEAGVALAGGADIIDAKEPKAGALGAVDVRELSAIVQAVQGKRPVSATIGDCDIREAAARVPAIAQTGVDYVKIGLFGAPTTAALGALGQCAGNGARLIAVMFADRLPEWAVIPHLAETGFAGVMLDTADKRRGGLRAHLGMAELAHFLREARSHGLMAGLAGSLRAEDAEALLPLRPDVLGFRGALCAGDERGETLEERRIAAMRRLLATELAGAA
jgi:(5-formylfuran-3-yl)methyl phosphate synthase